jgi:hypothetical protein
LIGLERLERLDKLDKLDRLDKSKLLSNILTPVNDRRFFHMRLIILSISIGS